MSPELCSGDCVIVYETRDLAPGDICCFNLDGAPMLHCVIAKPGDVVSIDEFGSLFVNNIAVPDSYGIPSDDRAFPLTVPDNCILAINGTGVFDISDDSVYVQYDDIVGKAILRIWPVNRIGRFQNG